METTLEKHKGLIEIELNNAKPEMVDKVKVCFGKMLEANIFNVRNGKVVLHFDSNGNLRQVEIQKIAWKG